MECIHCGAPVPAASRFCPACGKPFGVNSSDPADGDIESEADGHEAQDAEVQNTDSLDVDQTPPALHDPIPIGRTALLVVNVALFARLLGLLLMPPARRRRAVFLRRRSVPLRGDLLPQLYRNPLPPLRRRLSRRTRLFRHPQHPSHRRPYLLLRRDRCTVVCWLAQTKPYSRQIARHRTHLPCQSYRKVRRFSCL